MSYGKIFASTFSGSMYGAGPEVFAVWSYVIANTIDSQVELNPLKVGHCLGMKPEDVKAVIEKLCSPDLGSNNKQHEGRRLIKEGEFAYFVVSHSIYRAMRNEDERREYNRKKQAECREKRKLSLTVIDKSAVSAKAEAEAEAEAEASPHSGESGASAPAPKRFSKPSLDGVKLAADKAGLPDAEAVKFFNHYESNGWKVGRNPMKSLPHAIANWRCRWEENRKPTGPKPAEQGQIQEIINVPSL